MARRDFAYNALIAIFLLLIINQVLLMFSFRLDMAGLEDCMAYMGMELRSGKVYGDPARYPFQMLQYPPFYYWLTFFAAVPLEWITGDEVRAFYLAGRLVSLTGSFGALYVLYLFFYRIMGYSRRHSLMPVLLGVLFLTTHMFTVRPDGLKILLEVSLFVLAYRYQQNPSGKIAVLWIALAAMVLLSKQDAAIQVAVLALYLLCVKRYQAAFLWPVAAVAVAVIVLMVQTGGDGYALYSNLLMGITQGIDLVWTAALLKQNFITILVLLVWTAYGFYQLFTRQQYQLMAPLALLYLGAHFALLKWGANINYLIDLELALMCGLLVLYLKERRKRDIIIAVAGAFLIFFNDIQGRNVLFFQPWAELEAREVYTEHRKTARGLESALDAAACNDVILFNTKLTLFLHERTVLGTLFNEYPDLLEDVALSEQTMPKPIYAYTFGCEDYPDRQVCMAVPTADAERQVAYLREILRDGDQLVVEKRALEYPGWDLYHIYCANED